MHAQRVEPELLGEFDVAPGAVGGSVRQPRRRRQDVGALEEEALAIDRADPVVPLDLAKSDTALPAIAPFTVDEDLDGDRRQRLCAEFARPPQRRTVDVECPLDVVAAVRDHVIVLVDDLAVDDGAQQHRPLGFTVEADREAEVGALIVGIPTEHAEPVDAHRPGVVQVDRAPDAARIPPVVEAVPLLEDPGDVRAVVGARLRVAADLDGERVFAAEPRERGDVECVREEVALRIAEIGAVEPHIGLVEDAVEGDPPATTVSGRVRLEVVAVHDRPVARGELRAIAPVTGDGDLVPCAVVRVQPDRVPPHLVVGLDRDPTPLQFHRRDRTDRAPLV